MFCLLVMSVSTCLGVVAIMVVPSCFDDLFSWDFLDRALLLWKTSDAEDVKGAESRTSLKSGMHGSLHGFWHGSLP
ncbi:hypothetical protein VNO77_03310 [Canavalia gladiata]|uniref:Secreted protein n=1 Tax=Canavalia gladiata TaxID=3824 RepID=A0AAN9MV95_CANGL